MIRTPLRREPSWSVPIAVPRNALPGTDGASWFTARPRNGLVAGVGIILALALGWMAVANPKYAVALAVGLGLIVVVLVRPLYGALGLVALVPALSGLLPGFPVPNIRISELLIGTVGVTLLVMARRTATAPWGFLDWALLAYGTLWTFDGVLGAVTAHEHLSIGGWGTVAGQLQFFLLYRALRVTLRTADERHLALRVLYVASAVIAVIAILQEIHVPGVVSLIVTLTGQLPTGADGTITRATGLFDNWAALAGYLLPLVLVAFCLGLSDSVRSFRRVSFAVALALVLGLFVTAELSVIVCLLLGACVLGIRYGRGKVMLRYLGIGLIVVLVGAGGLLGKRLETQFAVNAGTGRSALVPQTIAFRWTVWTQQYIPAAERKPFTGYGVELPNSIQWAFPESQYITFLIQGGLPLLGMFVVLLWAMLREAKRARQSDDPVDRSLGEGVFVAVVSLVAINFIWPYLSNGGMPQLLWCLFALFPPAVDTSMRALGTPDQARLLPDLEYPGSVPPSGRSRDHHRSW
jgi:hypothetical protein